MEAYDYVLPSSFIAQKPASPRDSAQLFIYSRTTGKVAYDTFLRLAKYVPDNAVLVFNETKVIPARLILKKETGGIVRILYTQKKGNCILALADKPLRVGSKLFISKKIYFTVQGKEEMEYVLKPSGAIHSSMRIFEKYGSAPIPPYIKNTPLSAKDLKKQYQTVFAKNKGSVAAPTASLHFTQRLLKALQQKGIDITYITLHVGLGTFASITKKNIQEGKLHTEQYFIDKKTATFLNKAKKQGRPIIAVGTTTVRTLETATNKKGNLVKLSGETTIFIQPGYTFTYVDGIITNFHVPQSSLLMLVAAFIGKKTLFTLYDKAIKKKFSFFSFGDGMLLY